LSVTQEQAEKFHHVHGRFQDDANVTLKEAEEAVNVAYHIIDQAEKRIEKLTKALLEIESTPFDTEGFGTASEAASWMNERATQALSD
jgi:3-oxoacyl-[acyl-carrier-protein] synthase III